MEPSNNINNSEGTYDNSEAQGITNENGTNVPNPRISTVSLTEERSNAEAQYNPRNPAVRRIMREAQEMHRNSDDGVAASPLEDNLFEWHFTIRGTPGTEFEQGLYHGRIILPAEYPMKPPSIIMLTPNGRFETGVKICLSISSYHPETWRPSWSIRTALLALQSFMNTPSPGAIGSLELSETERRRLARQSVAWVCPICGPNCNSHVYRTHRTALGSNDVTLNQFDVVPASAALRVFHNPAGPARNLADEPAPENNDRPFHDNRAGDVPRRDVRDGPVDGNLNLRARNNADRPDIEGEQVIQLIFANANPNGRAAVREPPVENVPAEIPAGQVANRLQNIAVGAVVTLIVSIIVRRLVHFLF